MRPRPGDLIKLRSEAENESGVSDVMIGGIDENGRPLPGAAKLVPIGTIAVYNKRYPDHGPFRRETDLISIVMLTSGKLGWVYTGEMEAL